MRDYFKSLLMMLALFVTIFTPITYAEGEAAPFNKIVFFGDSLSDNGNLFSVALGHFPASPPYFQGRFSNGYVWSEQVAKNFYNQAYVSTSNRAYGGETAILRNPFNGFLPYSLTMSLDKYLFDTILRDRSRTLFVIWIGANDYLPQEDPGSVQDRNKLVDELTSGVVGSIKAAIESLIYHGGTNILVINLPNIAKSPYATANNKIELLGALSDSHNAKLANAISEIQNSYKQVNVHLYDVNNMFLNLFADVDGFNKKYNTHLTNVTTSCWQGGYTFAKGDTQVNEDDIARKLEESIRAQSKSSKAAIAAGEENKLDTRAFAHYIATTPSLVEAYKTSEGAQQGAKPCKNPDEYVFWDHIHPTAIMHELLSKELTAYIEQNYSVG